MDIFTIIYYIPSSVCNIIIIITSNIIHTQISHLFFFHLGGTISSSNKNKWPRSSFHFTHTQTYSMGGGGMRKGRYIRGSRRKQKRTKYRASALCISLPPLKQKNQSMPEWKDISVINSYQFICQSFLRKCNIFHGFS